MTIQIFIMVMVIAAVLSLTNMAAWQSVEISQRVKSHNELNAVIFKHLNRNRSRSDNVLVPESVTSLVMMLHQGSGSGTEYKLAKLLGLGTWIDGEHFVPMPKHQVGSAIRAARPTGTATRGFASNNLLLHKSSLQLAHSFEQRLQQYFEAQVHQLNHSSPLVEMMERANEFAAERSNGRIVQLLPKPPQSDAELLLLNTFYVKAEWKRPFERASDNPARYFSQNSNHNISADYMTNRGFYPYNDDRFRMAELPYTRNGIGFCVMLPQHGYSLFPWTALEHKLPQYFIDSRIGLREAKWSMPKFDITRRSELKQHLFTQADDDSCDLSNVAESSHPGSEGQPPLGIGEMHHVARAVVDELGIEVAAVTYATLHRRQSSATPLEFNLNQPFAFFLRDHTTGGILVLGKVDQLDANV